MIHLKYPCGIHVRTRSPAPLCPTWSSEVTLGRMGIFISLLEIDLEISYFLCRQLYKFYNDSNHAKRFRKHENNIRLCNMYIPGVPTSFGQEFGKKSLNVTNSEKTRESLFTF